MGDLVLFTAPKVVASNGSVNISIRCATRWGSGLYIVYDMHMCFDVSLPDSCTRCRGSPARAWFLRFYLGCCDKVAKTTLLSNEMHSRVFVPA